MRPAALLLLPLLAACAAPAVEPDPADRAAVEVHPRFAALRPAMVQLRVDGQGEGIDELRDGLYRGLIAKGYSVLAPGAAGGSEVGIFRVRVLGGGMPGSVEATLEDPFGTVLYRYVKSPTPGGPSPGTGAILERLPAK